jgi:hypothetical protein
MSRSRRAVRALRKVFAREKAKKRLDRYADYEEMDEYPLLLSQQPYCDYEEPRRTPLQELTERVWAEHDITDPPIIFDIVVDPAVEGAWPRFI